MNHEYFSSLIDDLRQEADRHGYDLTLLGRGKASGKNYYEHALQRNLDGVIILAADFDSPDVIRLAAGSLPAVTIDHPCNGCDCVISDNRASMDQIVRYVRGLGHSRIAFIHGQDGAVTRERLSGFYKSCAELGIRVPAPWVREGRFHDPGECAGIIRQLLREEEKPTCVLCPDDYSCIGALWLLKSQGIGVPEEISLVGYDGISMTRMMQPRLTTYRQDTARIAGEVFRLIVDAIAAPDTHVLSRITVPGMLVEGETVQRRETL